MEIQSYIEKLFRYLETYETKYSDFETEAFIQTYNGIRAVFKALREQRNQAVEIDYFFLDAIKTAPLTNSDLRQITVQVLISFFESEADVDGRSNQAYGYCRGLRPVKQDVPFIEERLIPLLFTEGGLNNNFRLHDFLFEEICRFLNLYGRPLKGDMTPEEFDSLVDPIKMLVLARRRQQLGTELLSDRSSLEFDLLRVNALQKLSQKNRFFELYFGEWNYLYKPSFWTRIKSALAVIGGKGKGIFSSFRYSRLMFSQRRPAFLKYGLFIIFWILLAIMVPRWWSGYEKSQLQELNKRVENVRQHSGK